MLRVLGIIVIFAATATFGYVVIKDCKCKMTLRKPHRKTLEEFYMPLRKKT